MTTEPTEADKAAAEEIGNLLRSVWMTAETARLDARFNSAVVDAAELLAQHMAPERQAAAAMRTALDAFYKHLDSYGVVGRLEDGKLLALDESDPEFASQQRCFELYHKANSK